MKRGAPDHWKMRELARIMKVPVKYSLAWANGTMERLWHYTAKYHPQGDIGKAPNWAIAEACGWPVSSAKELVDGLTACGWLDLDPKHRLIVHDWPDHADNTVKKTLKNRGLEFFLLEKVSTSAGKISPAFPKPLPEPSHIPAPDMFADFWGLFVEAGKPLNDRDKEAALKVWLNLKDSDQPEVIAWVKMQLIDRWTQEKYTPMPVKVLRDEGWKRVAQPRQPVKAPAAPVYVPPPESEYVPLADGPPIVTKSGETVPLRPIQGPK